MKHSITQIVTAFKTGAYESVRESACLDLTYCLCKAIKAGRGLEAFQHFERNGRHGVYFSTLFEKAAKYNDIDLIDYMLKFPADIVHKENYRNVLAVAIKHGHQNLADKMRDRYSSKTYAETIYALINHSGVTTDLQGLISHMYVDDPTYLEPHRDAIKSAENLLHDGLRCAAIYGNRKMFAFMLELGAKIDREIINNIVETHRTAIALMCIERHPETRTKLLEVAGKKCSSETSYAHLRLWQACERAGAVLT